ncbi:SUMF1/EgtB/PvdO family nonheme iron enzyme [uncultured Draconibacterium sp.]|uniref:type IX secretion system lipoprotein PorK/GldK n=1 Tax=uncultured Draconibacterium sp. TaxID=1573823 RepID=UPI0025DBC312|nr:SUMF1/EgtB/PvdO family nonheme iron enzyme [uncultured Draconibacterium sp.]
MRKTITYLFILTLFLASCRNESNKYLTLGKGTGEKWFEPTPFGMVYVERGSYNIGPNDDELYPITQSRTISTEAFWIDDTEITNNEYRQFVYWVRDKKARELLGQTYTDFLITEDKYGAPLEEPKINWDERIEWDDPEYQMAMDELYIPENERFGYKKEIDARKLVYEYYWVDYKQAAKRSNAYNYETQRYEGSVVNSDGELVPIENRSSFLMRESVPVYPDTLCWIRDFAYTYNEPFTMKYFSHIGFDDYPVVGVTWDQARAFCNWRNNLSVIVVDRFNEAPAHDYRLPTESEWEIAARGGMHNNMYPWGSYYTRNVDGCFVANFKPLRGNYVADSPTTTTAMKVGQFDPNPYGVYDMAGNVAEWTSTAFFEAGYNAIDDYNPEIQYDARPDDPPVMKRKVVRGGSWKDIAYYIQSGTRTFEYQDTAKSYIGFRCVRTSFRDDLGGRRGIQE